jgi:hypothetical protein
MNLNKSLSIGCCCKTNYLATIPPRILAGFNKPNKVPPNYSLTWFDRLLIVTSHNQE